MFLPKNKKKFLFWFLLPICNWGLHHLDYKRSYCVIVYAGNFWPPNCGTISVQFLLYTLKYLLFIPISFFHLPPPVVSIHGHGEHARRAQAKGVTAGSRACQNCFHGYAYKIIQACYLLHQAEAQCRVPVRFPFPQGTGESSSAHYSWVWPRDRNFDLAINPVTHIKNGFIHFLYHESSQIR